MFMNMPHNFTNANFRGLPSCLSLAKGMVVSASIDIMAAARKIYSGRLAICNICEIGLLNATISKANNMVEKIKEILVVLYIFCLSEF